MILEIGLVVFCRVTIRDELLSQVHLRVVNIELSLGGLDIIHP